MGKFANAIYCQIAEIYKFSARLYSTSFYKCFPIFQTNSEQRLYFSNKARLYSFQSSEIVISVSSNHVLYAA